MQGLEFPVVVNQPERKPIEQLWVRRRRAQLTKVIGGADNSPTEMMLPDAIDNHARGEHISRRRDPFGQNSATAGGSRILRSARESPAWRRRIISGSEARPPRRERADCRAP